MFENEKEIDSIFSLFSEFAKCNAIIDVIHEEKLAKLDEERYSFGNMAYIVQKVFDNNGEVIKSFADYLIDLRNHLNEYFDSKNI